MDDAFFDAVRGVVNLGIRHERLKVSPAES